MTDENTGKMSLSRRKISNLLLAPKKQFKVAVVIFASGFVIISVLFGMLLFRLEDMLHSLVAASADPEQAAAITASTPLLLWSTYGIFLLTFLCSALFLALTVTHRYLGPMVPIKRQVKALLAEDYSLAIHLRKEDEFQDLADDLNELTARLKNKAGK